ncbi:MAG: septation protein IspZ [Steroidobacteraceae bacterium]
MQALTGLAPLLAFFVTYALRGLYAATAVLMVAMLLLLGFDWLRQKRIPQLHALSTVLVLIFGGATLLLHNRIFIQWKATLFLWLLSGGFVASAWVGERTLAERFLAPALESWRSVSAALWQRANAWSAAFYAVLGAANLGVAYYASERAWVYFKVFGLALLTFAFLVAQLLWLSARAQPAPAPAEPAP